MQGACFASGILSCHCVHAVPCAVLFLQLLLRQQKQTSLISSAAAIEVATVFK
jgi:hypothetical protein